MHKMDHGFQQVEGARALDAQLPGNGDGTLMASALPRFGDIHDCVLPAAKSRSYFVIVLQHRFPL